jgi:4-methyl-5(b-hydroxyethyl)-thiazole monophosphate biosynthesis
MATVKRVLVILGPGFEEIEALTPVDLLRRAGVEVVMASATGEPLIKGRTGIVVQSDATLEGLDTAAFDLLLIPGGPGVQALRADGRPARIARSFVESGRPVAAICAAPTVLADAGLLVGKRYTAHFSVHQELGAAEGDERVVEDGLVITSRGAGTAVDFGFALVRRLCGRDEADEVARSIMA